MEENTRQQLAEIAMLWNALEGRLKEVELFRSAAVVASVNEMRYAGRRVVDVLMADGTSTQGFDSHENLAIARNYLVNADHDLTDSVIYFTQERIALTMKRHGKKKIERFCPEFAGLYPSILEAQNIVKASREVREKRTEEYDRLATEFIPRVMALYKQLEGEPKLSIDNSVLEFWVRVNAGLATAGAIAGILALALGAWGIWLIYYPP